MQSPTATVDCAAVTQDVAGQSAVHLDLDGAWPADILGLPRLDVRAWGPALRYITTKNIAEQFWKEVEGKLPKFIVYGSGDFHHLAGLFLRRIEGEPFTLVSFDNHPDWDIRPPYWSCGGWAARALRSGRVKRVSVWGCGNFELRWPARLFADRAASGPLSLVRGGEGWGEGRNVAMSKNDFVPSTAPPLTLTLSPEYKGEGTGASPKLERTFEINAWAERQPPSVQRRFNCITRENWRRRFEQFAATLPGERIYITVDMDCLRREEAITNWENGLFTAEDVAWAIGRLKQSADLVGADVCGAHSPQRYARLGQKLAGRWDHPKLPAVAAIEARRANEIALRKIWIALQAQQNDESDRSEEGRGSAP